MRQDVKVTYFSDIIGRFDKQAGKIYGVSVITEGKAKGHDLIVDSQTLMEIKDAAENCADGRLKTKLNHRSGMESVFGYLENFRVEGPKLLADLKMLKSHKDYEQTFEQIEALPNAIGLSVAFVGKEAHNSSGHKLARCREILSADLVPEPAANPTGMFEAKNAAMVDTEILNNMNESTTEQPTGQPAAAANAEPTLGDVMNFLQEQILPRIEATEQFQAAIQAELDAAEGGEGEEGEGEGGDAGTGHATGAAAHVDRTANGGTDGGSPSSPAMAGAAAGQELTALHNAVVMLERKIADKENTEREAEFETAMSVIKDKTEAVVEYARNLEQDNVILLEALRTGARPVKQSPSEIFKGGETQTDFQSRVTAHVAAGKSKTEAVMLARKEDPAAHLTWLESQGVVTNL